MASSSFLQGALLQKSTFLGHNPHKNGQFPTFPKQTQNPKFQFSPSAKFNLLEILGGRGLCNGEAGLQEELKKSVSPEKSTNNVKNSESPEVEVEFPEAGFDKELLGLTGGFPGGEKGLQKFIEENPPPKKPTKTDEETKATAGVKFNQSLVKKAKPPQLPMLLPGMIVIVKNDNSPYHMYCGIIQRITDGRAGVLFEGGVWDRLITFRLEELERRQKGPPMVNPRSAVLETILEKRAISSSSSS